MGGELVDSDTLRLRGIYEDLCPPKSGLATSSFELWAGISTFFTLLESFSDAFWRDFSLTPPSEAFRAGIAALLAAPACFAEPVL